MRIAIIVFGGWLSFFAAAAAGAAPLDNPVRPPLLAAQEAPFPLGGRPANPPGAGGPQGWLRWNPNDFLGPCAGDCSLALYGGPEIRTAMTRVFLLRSPVPMWDWKMGRSGIVAGAFSRRLATLWGGLDLEPEFGVAQRFDGMSATEFWAAMDFRWTVFPWNAYIKTTIALAEGVSLATRVDEEERLRNSNHRGSIVLNFFSPEVTFALPDAPAYELVFRFHHRSGIWGLINGVDAGSQFTTVGFRCRF
jgi:hypothetical protein